MIGNKNKAFQTNIKLSRSVYKVIISLIGYIDRDSLSIFISVRGLYSERLHFQDNNRVLNAPKPIIQNIRSETFWSKSRLFNEKAFFWCLYMRQITKKCGLCQSFRLISNNFISDNKVSKSLTEQLVDYLISLKFYKNRNLRLCQNVPVTDGITHCAPPQ